MTDLTLEEANKTICKFEGSDPWKEYLISCDRGESYCMLFSSLHEAHHFLEVENPDFKSMGYKVIEKERWRNYISLDALVPVWEKLKHQTGYKNLCIETECLNFDKDGWFWRFGMNCAPKISRTYETIQEAACISTAKAILEFGDRG